MSLTWPFGMVGKDNQLERDELIATWTVSLPAKREKQQNGKNNSVLEMPECPNGGARIIILALCLCGFDGNVGKYMSYCNFVKSVNRRLDLCTFGESCQTGELP